MMSTCFAFSLNKVKTCLWNAKWLHHSLYFISSYFSFDSLFRNKISNLTNWKTLFLLFKKVLGLHLVVFKDFSYSVFRNHCWQLVLGGPFEKEDEYQNWACPAQRNHPTNCTIPNPNTLPCALIFIPGPVIELIDWCILMNFQCWVCFHITLVAVL